MADPERLRQVFVNLIINAINAMSYGGSLIISSGFISGERFTTRVDPTATKSQPAYIEIKIKDTGQGIPDDALDKIFEPFHTSSKHKQGIGLGLPISRKFVEQHGGTISVTSDAGKGTAFVIELPLSQSQ